MKTNKYALCGPLVRKANNTKLWLYKEFKASFIHINVSQPPPPAFYIFHPFVINMCLFFNPFCLRELHDLQGILFINDDVSGIISQTRRTADLQTKVADVLKHPPPRKRRQERKPIITAGNQNQEELACFDVCNDERFDQSRICSSSKSKSHLLKSISIH